MSCCYQNPLYRSMYIVHSYAFHSVFQYDTTTEEMLATDSALWWAPNGTHILYASFNDSQVRDYQFPKYGPEENVYTEIESIAYPKVCVYVHVIAILMCMYYLQ